MIFCVSKSSHALLPIFEGTDKNKEHWKRRLILCSQDHKRGSPTVGIEVGSAQAYLKFCLHESLSSSVMEQWWWWKRGSHMRGLLPFVLLLSVGGCQLGLSRRHRSFLRKGELGLSAVGLVRSCAQLASAARPREWNVPFPPPEREYHFTVCF